ncbi:MULTISPECIES: helix-turn-helix domain-containing protein [Streptomyces]|uniref:Helix-turn-helix domain-containing protein n=1 Tax=Streptomyces changanensis TaxID=2964669 RepID=A0ABY5N2W6_9ACTN|nr:MULTISPECIES: helix-turn-helix transcriptional regulator [Streptomyces]UUS30874.1 helix-turn-helix domain-containing protein [Streptomyces changanensis]
MKPNGVAIRALRTANRCGLRELEEKTGLSRGYLSRLERGERGASPDTVLLIAHVLDVPPEAITREDL